MEKFGFDDGNTFSKEGTDKYTFWYFLLHDFVSNVKFKKINVKC